jgi:hypothetical protein
LVRRLEFPQSWTIATITVTGNSSCRATIQHVLKPGFREYSFRRLQGGGIAYYDRPRVISSTCEIQ